MNEIAGRELVMEMKDINDKLEEINEKLDNLSALKELVEILRPTAAEIKRP